MDMMAGEDWAANRPSEMEQAIYAISIIGTFTGGLLIGDAIATFLATAAMADGDPTNEISALISEGRAIRGEGFSVAPNKFNYFFGRVEGKNLKRSLQNLKDLNSLGITTESQLMNVFEKAYKQGTLVGIIEKTYGYTLVQRIALDSGGKIDVSFFYSASNMLGEPIVSSIIPKTF